MDRERLVMISFGIVGALVLFLMWTVRESGEYPAWLTVDPTTLLFGLVLVLLVMRIVLWRIIGRANKP
jgi:hypothetical protein